MDNIRLATFLGIQRWSYYSNWRSQDSLCTKCCWYWILTSSCWSSRIYYLQSRRTANAVLLYWHKDQRETYRNLYWFWRYQSISRSSRLQIYSEVSRFWTYSHQWYCQDSLCTKRYWYWSIQEILWSCRVYYLQSRREANALLLCWNKRSRESICYRNRIWYFTSYWRIHSVTHICRATIWYNTCIWRSEDFLCTKRYWYWYTQKDWWFCRVYYLQSRREANVILLYWRRKRQQICCCRWIWYSLWIQWCICCYSICLRNSRSIQSQWRSTYCILSYTLWFWYIQEILWCSRISYCQPRRETTPILLRR